MKKLQNKTAVVTGAASGLGRATAQLLAQQGANLVIFDLNRERLIETKTELEQRGAGTIAIDGDVTDADTVRRGMEEAAARWGRIDVVFANAGMNGTLSPIEHLEVEEWDRTISVNLKSTFLTVKYAIPYMKKDGGSIIITSSINGSRVFRGFGKSAYSSAKAGQIAFAKMAALELARYSIRVNVICPGWFKTNIGENTFETGGLEEVRIPIEFPEGHIPLGGPGDPEQVAELVLFLASDSAKHITGTELFIDGAESLL